MTLQSVRVANTILKRYIYICVSIVHFSATVSEGREVQTSFKITPYRAGLCQVCATFRSDVISGVRGYGSLKISE